MNSFHPLLMEQKARLGLTVSAGFHPPGRNFCFYLLSDKNQTLQ